jgi:thrombospondin motif-containing protein 9
MCGVCGGDNTTCQIITGHFNSDVKFGYNHVLLLPAGAANIDIRQYGYQGSNNDDNYIGTGTLLFKHSSECFCYLIFIFTRIPVLKTSKPGKYLLNGNFALSSSMKRKTYTYEGTVLQYSGTETVVERLTLSLKPLQRDLIVEVLSIGNLRPPNITYHYTISASEFTNYRWVLGEWADCSHVCQGSVVTTKM